LIKINNFSSRTRSIRHAGHWIKSSAGFDPASRRQRKEPNTWIPASAGMTVDLNFPLVREMTSRRATA
jgi:hypothetical protein